MGSIILFFLMESMRADWEDWERSYVDCDYGCCEIETWGEAFSCIATIPTCASMILGVIGVLGWKAHRAHAYFQTVFWEVRYEWQNVD